MVVWLVPEEHFPALLLLFYYGQSDAGRCFLPPTSPLFAYNHGHGRPMPGATLRFTPASQKSPPFSLFFRISGANFQWNNAFNTFKNQTGIWLL